MNTTNNKQPGSSYFARAVINGGLVAGCLVFGATAQAAITFEFDYSGNIDGVGFLDATYGAARQQALTDAGTLFSSMFGSHFSNTGTIKLAVTSTDDALSDTLASAGSELFGTGTPGFNLVDVVRTKLVTGVDANGVDIDGLVDVNWGHAWQLDPNTPASGSEFDFYATINHELTHALGFSSNVGETGRDPFLQRNPGEYGKFDSFLADGSGLALIDAGGYLDRQYWIDTSTTDIYFNGAHAVAANGGNLVGLFSPATWMDGSSVSHLDTDNPQFYTTMMKHDRGYGPEARAYSAIEVGIMTDLGYTPAIPEPETYALMLAGLGLVGFMARRRKA